MVQVAVPLKHGRQVPPDPAIVPRLVGVTGPLLAVAGVREHEPELPGVLLQPVPGLGIRESWLQRVVDLPGGDVHRGPKLMLRMSWRRHEAGHLVFGFGTVGALTARDRLPNGGLKRQRLLVRRAI